MTTLADFNKTCVLIGNDVDTGRPLGVPSQITITGSGFGSGPNVILFDRFDSGQAGEIINLQGAELGSWANYNNHNSSTGDARYVEYNGRKWMATRNLDQVDDNIIATTGLRFNSAIEFSEFRWTFRTVVPLGRKLCGTTTPNSTENSGSNWKLNWFGRSEEGYAANAKNGQPDLVIPTNGQPNGSVSVSGNNVNPAYYDSGYPRQPYYGPSGIEENLFTYYQKSETTDLGTDGVLDYGLHSVKSGESNFTRTTPSQVTIWQGQQGPITTKSFNMFYFNAWMGNGGNEGYNNVLPLMADSYLAVGENSRACLYVSDAATLANSTKAYMIPPDSWNDTEIKYTPRFYENLPFKHIITSAGTLKENV